MAPKFDDAALERELKTLTAKKEMYFVKIQRNFDYIKDLDKDTILNKFKAEYNTLNRALDELKNVVDSINEVSLKLDDNFLPNYQIIDSAEQLFGHIQEAYKLIQSNKNESNQNPLPKAFPRLPQIDVMEFSGDKKQWPLFYESFCSLVDKNKELDDTSKIHYLLAALKGKALDMCVGILPTAANYNVLLTTLKERFEDKRLLANTYLSQIVDFKPSQNESVSSLNAFLEKFDTAVSALKNLKLPDLADYILVFIAISKLDSQTHKFFEMSRTDPTASTTLPKYEELLKFIKNQSKTLSHTSKLGGQSSKLNNSSSSSNSHRFNNSYSKSKITQSFVTNTKSKGASVIDNCPICKQRTHSVIECDSFLKLSPANRYKVVKEKYLCLNCLSSKHRIANCAAISSCNVCKVRHHTLLHFNKTPSSSNENAVTDILCEPPVVVTENENVVSNTTLSLCSTSNKSPQNYTTLLSTAIINIETLVGESKQIRVLLDTASQSNFITYKCCQKLQLPIQQVYCSVRGIGESTRPVKGQVTDLTISSRLNSNVKYKIDALVVDKITDKLPTSNINTEALDYLSNLPLADSEFHRPSEIDAIIGAQLMPQILGVAKLVGPPDMPIAVQTTLGYVIMGKAPTFSTENIQSFCSIVEPTLDGLIQKFWEVEEIPVTSNLNVDDTLVENLFTSTVKRDCSGRYTVTLPFINYPPVLGDSFRVALRRFILLEKKLQASTTFRDNYSNVIRDYLEQGHLSLVNTNENDTSYYIPHFAVLKTSSSTPLRIVFDASAKTSNSCSLNDVLYSGPKLQTDIVKILLNFRLFKIAMISDVRQMYRNIWVNPEQRRYQRILWRFSPNQPLRTYELNTVTFGLKPAPFLALRTVKQLCIDEAQKYPMAAKVVETDIYIDDVICSVTDLAEAKILYGELLGLFKAGGFDLVKWSTNCGKLLQEIPQNIRGGQTIEFNDGAEFASSLKVLGLKWNPIQDTFSFEVHVPDKKCSKRNILSTVARIWDPLGFLSPVTLYAKLLIKELWVAKIDWDEAPPNHIVNLWSRFHNELSLLESYQVPRYLGIVDSAQISLFGFADACSQSFGAVVYIKIVTPQNQIIVNLLCSKSKVAPLKVVTVARLELCAALLLAKLLKYVTDSISSRIHIEQIFAFTDSTVTLSWIGGASHRWKVFVANRVSKIQSLFSKDIWYHVDGENNPADCLSRGMTPGRFVENATWVSGPTWMTLPQREWPVRSVRNFTSSTEEEILVVPALVELHTENDPLRNLMLRISSWTKLLRITVYVLKFCRILPRSKSIVASDLERAERVLIHMVQRLHFSSDIKLLENKKLCSPSLRKLSPFLDSNGLLRVGGRLSQAKIDFDQQHPYLLPKKDNLVNMLVDHIHSKNLHTGPHLSVSLLRQKYWILSARSIVRKRINSCNFCFKYRPKAIFPVMANLPECRVAEVKPFVECGVDYAGPFYITMNRHRGVKSQKAYLCLFVCLSTKALHLELASDLTTTTFLNCFKRFLARRGPCRIIHSDCGTNFVGAKAELDSIYKFLQSDEYTQTIGNELSLQKIVWKFNPPNAPHFGGIWESNIKSVKTHLNKVVGSQILSYEELSTVLVQIEALLNSRPLCWLSADPAEPLALTPAHFLTFTPLQTLPATDVSNQRLNRLSRKQLLDQMVQSYWNRWRLEYLNTLQVRQKWNTPACPARRGMVVLVQQNNTPPLQWPMGIIEEIFPSTDGVSRIAIVKTKSGHYRRPIVRLCPLPSQ